MSAKVSIIIPVKNHWDLTRQCIRSIAFNTEYKNYELIVVDNASTDETEAGLANYIQQFIDLGLITSAQVIRNKENKNFSISNNQGRSASTGNYLCLLNNDTIVTKGWLKNMLRVFRKETKVGVVGARLVYPGSGEIQHAGVIFMGDGSTDHIHHRIDQDNSLVMKRKEYPAMTAACLLVPIELYDKAGGLDERYNWGWEDIVLCNMIKEFGYKIIYEPTARVYHYGSQTEGRYDFENSNLNLYMREWAFNKRNETKRYKRNY